MVKTKLKLKPMLKKRRRHYFFLHRHLKKQFLYKIKLIKHLKRPGIYFRYVSDFYKNLGYYYVKAIKVDLQLVQNNLINRKIKFDLLCSVYK